MNTKIKVKGFFRIQIEEDGKIVGDSGLNKNGKLFRGDGMRPNQVANLGFLNYLVKALMGSAGSVQVSHLALGTGGAPAAGDTALAGEIMASTQRIAPTLGTINSTTAQFTATFASSDNFLTLSQNLSNIGLFGSSAANNLFAGNTYTSSSCNTNQNVNVTYQIRFS